MIGAAPTLGRGSGRDWRLLGATLLAVLAPALAPADSQAQREAGLARSLERQLGPGAEVDLSSETGRVGFIGVARADAIAQPLALRAAPPATAARGFLRRHAGALGLGPHAALRARGVLPTARGGSAVRLRQLYRGLPVLGGEFVINLTASRAVLSAAGEASPVRSLDTVPATSASAAIGEALSVSARAHATTVSRLRPSEPALWVYDPRLLGAPGPTRPLLVWRLEVRSEDDPLLRELVLVEADHGYVPLRLNLTRSAMTRSICDAFNTPTHVPCTFPVRTEGQGPTGNPDADSAYEFAGDTYAFYASRFGRDSLDGGGLPLVSTVRYCEPGEPCPYPNAFWDTDERQMVYGQGFAAADDVVGHELTHGVTQFESNLLPWYQSGAIGESLSDVFGEFVDLTNGKGDDSAAVRWQIGEDLPSGAIRDMADPPAIGDPDRMTSPLYVGDPDQFDSGGIHGNAGVGNKAAALITDGGTFNGQSVAAIGLDKAAQIYYAVNTAMLTSGSDYADLANALPQACTNLVGAAGISTSDCAEVAKAVAATEMSTDPPAARAPEAPVCGTGETDRTIFLDDMELDRGWTLGGAAPWEYVGGESEDAAYATSGTRSLYTPNRSTVTDSQAISPPISIPAVAPAGGVHLRFAHSYAFDDDADDAGGTYDGGVLEYSVDGGATWADAGPLFTAGGYNGVVATGFDNPLAGRPAFVRESRGYISSRVNLGSLLGTTVRFRLREGTDISFGDFGWAVDDFHVYGCSDTGAPESAITSGPAEGAALTRRAVTFTFASSEPSSTFQCSLDGAPFTACSSPLRRVLTDRRHRFAVRAVDPPANADPTPAAVTFRVAAARPRTKLRGAAIDHDAGRATFRFAGSAGLPPLRFLCKLDRRPYRPCRSPRTYRNLEPGEHLFRVRAVDRLGRVDRTAARRPFQTAG
jgi:Zn-dependent metalloprotease